MKARPILVIDIGGTNVKLQLSGQRVSWKFASGSRLTPAKLVAGDKALAINWEYDVISMGYPGVVRNGRIAVEPFNLGKGWVGFSFSRAFRRPVRVMNDAVMQALGSYRGGTMLFLGLGTGLGTALVVRGHVVPMELGHFPYIRTATRARRGRSGRTRWLDVKRALCRPRSHGTADG